MGQNEPMFTRVEHLALHVADVPSAADYFIDTFGFERLFDTTSKSGFPITFIQLGGTMVELTTRPGGEPMSGFHFCLEAKDIEAAARTLEARGLSVVTPLRTMNPRAGQEGWKRGVFRGRYGEIIEIKGA